MTTPDVSAPGDERAGRSSARAARDAGAGLSRPLAPIDSADLFAGAREVQIVHRGEIYRLKLTASGKLILTK